MAKLLSGTRIYGTATIDTQLFVSGTTISVSTNTGALQVVGGVGIGKDLYVGGTIYSTSSVVATSFSSGGSGDTTNVIGYPDEYGWRDGLYGAATFFPSFYPSWIKGIWYNSTDNLSYVEFRNGTYGSFVVTNSGINGSIKIRVTDSSSVIVTSISAQSYDGGVRFVFSGDPWNLLAGGSTGFFNWYDLSYIGGDTETFNTSTLVALAVTATNALELIGGAVGSIAYQSSPNVTDFISIGPNGYVLTSNGTTATWQASSGGTASLGNIITTAQGWNLP
jgi:hypothetical protein